MSEDLELRIVGVDPGETIAGARRIVIRSTRGPIPILLHAAPQPLRAVICVSGSYGGYDGPAALYARLGLSLPRKGISVARVDYRAPNEFQECLLDTLAASSFLKGIEYRRAAIIGHSFGGAVAIHAGSLSPISTSVIAMSSQLHGAHVVADISPRSLMLIHGTGDTILSHESSQILYDRAREPKEIKLFAGADHGLSQVGDELAEFVENWLIEKV